MKKCINRLQYTVLLVQMNCVFDGNSIKQTHIAMNTDVFTYAGSYNIDLNIGLGGIKKREMVRYCFKISQYCHHHNFKSSVHQNHLKISI